MKNNKAVSEMVLVPMLDILNHRNPSEASWRYNEEKDGIELYLKTEIGSGDEINISYGS